MNLERYFYLIKGDFQNYEFYSEGPKGKIRKVISFTQIEDNPAVYNLGFGDELENGGLINDLAVTDNKDRDRVLATVAYTVVDFSNHYGKHYIYAIGSTPSRTRLYQMSIASLLEDIISDFELFGLKDGEWHAFQRNVNYKAFLVRKK